MSGVAICVETPSLSGPPGPPGPSGVQGLPGPPGPNFLTIPEVVTVSPAAEEVAAFSVTENGTRGTYVRGIDIAGIADLPRGVRWFTTILTSEFGGVGAVAFIQVKDGYLIFRVGYLHNGVIIPMGVRYNNRITTYAVYGNYGMATFYSGENAKTSSYYQPYAAAFDGNEKRCDKFEIKVYAEGFTVTAIGSFNFLFAAQFPTVSSIYNGARYFFACNGRRVAIFNETGALLRDIDSKSNVKIYVGGGIYLTATSSPFGEDYIYSFTAGAFLAYEAGNLVLFNQFYTRLRTDAFRSGGAFSREYLDTSLFSVTVDRSGQGNFIALRATRFDGIGTRVYTNYKVYYTVGKELRIADIDWVIIYTLAIPLSLTILAKLETREEYDIKYATIFPIKDSNGKLVGGDMTGTIGMTQMLQYTPSPDNIFIVYTVPTTEIRDDQTLETRYIDSPSVRVAWVEYPSRGNAVFVDDIQAEGSAFGITNLGITLMGDDKFEVLIVKDSLENNRVIGRRFEVGQGNNRKMIPLDRAENAITGIALNSAEPGESVEILSSGVAALPEGMTQPNGVYYESGGELSLTPNGKGERPVARVVNGRLVV